jgi:hypothetical protein
MKIPTRFSQHERYLDPFVNAAQTKALLSACDVLFIHGNDLTWGEARQGHFLIDVDVDENVEEVAQVVEARVKIGLSRILKPLISNFQSIMMDSVSDVAIRIAQQPAVDEKEVIGAFIASKFSSGPLIAELERKISAFFSVGQLPLLTDAIASWLVRDAYTLRQRQMAAAGMTDERYRAMLYSLRRLDLCERIARIAYPEEGFHFELSLSSPGEFRLTEARDDARLVEIFRLKPSLATFKQGRDNALAMFIADYINTQFNGPQQAFACAQYGEQSAPEFDVLIPALGVGFEVKLYQAPFAHTKNKLDNPANQLRKQMAGYADIGCALLYYVSNLNQSMAEDVLKKVREASGPVIEVRPVAGNMDVLLPLLNELVALLEQVREAQINREIEQRVTAASIKKTKKAPAKSKKVAGRKNTKK